jgi:hypothetical protein
MGIEQKPFGPEPSGEPQTSDEHPAPVRLLWRKPRLHRMQANDAQAKGRPGVEFTRHLTS